MKSDFNVVFFKNTFKLIFLIILIILINLGYTTNLFSQNVAVTDDDTYTASPSAMLDVKSTTKGMLIPRLTTIQREAINPAALGLLVFDTDKNAFYYYNNEEWLALPQVSSSTVEGNALFAVKNAAGDTIFAVYNDGVKVVVPYGTKGKVGGFAVSGRSPTKVGEEEYLLVTPDSTRVFVNEVDVKGKVGGFAVSGRSPTKTVIKDYFISTLDSTRIYVPEGITKGKVGGFAVSGRSPTKLGATSDYFNISGNSQADTVKNEPRIMWYPVKSAFLAGEVHVGTADSVGTNSTSLGYRTIAKGNYSQAMGYKSQSLGVNSTAIGNQAVAKDSNSVAFGQFAQAKNKESYAFGRGAISEGFRSYAFGSAGVDSAGVLTGVAYAEGDYSFAIGQGSHSLGKGSFAIGIDNTSTGEFSVAIGYKAQASGYGSIALGYRTQAQEESSTALGYYSKAEGIASMAAGYGSVAKGFASTAMGSSAAYGNWSASLNTAWAKGTLSTAMGDGTISLGMASTSMGYYNIARGTYSVTMGYRTKANTYAMVAVGRWNDTTRYATDSYNVWYSTDPLFVVGNGTTDSKLKNAFTVLKNGNIGIGTPTPTSKFEIYSTTGSNLSLNSDVSNMILYNTSGVGAPTFTTRSAGTKLVLYPGVTTTKTDYAIGIEDWTLWFSVPSNTDRFKFYAGTNEIMRIQGDGKVGVGTTAPTHKIDVRGPVRIVNDPDYYDVWIQGGSATGGDDRNLAILGKDEDSGDQLFINYDAEYAYGTVIPGYVGIGSTAGNNSSYKLYVYGSAGGTSWTNTSDIRWKKNIKPLGSVLNSILDLMPVKYEWKVDEFPQMNFDNKIHIGLIAQDLEKYFPELVFTDNDGYKSVAYDKLSAVLIEGMKEQQNQIQNQQSEIETLKSENNQLNSSYQVLKNEIEQIKKQIELFEKK